MGYQEVFMCDNTKVIVVQLPNETYLKLKRVLEQRLFKNNNLKITLSRS